MKIKEPKNDERFLWTRHVFEKMKFYRLSEQRVRRVLRNSKRREEGIAPNTIAVGELTGSKSHPYEIWVMYQLIKSKVKNPAFAPPSPKATEGHGKSMAGKQKSKIIKPNKIRIISAWRYPGISPEGKPIYIPEDTLKLKDLASFNIAPLEPLTN